MLGNREDFEGAGELDAMRCYDRGCEALRARDIPQQQRRVLGFACTCFSSGLFFFRRVAGGALRLGFRKLTRGLGWLGCTEMLFLRGARTKSKDKYERASIDEVR